MTRVEDGAVPDVVWRLVYRDREFSGYAVMSLSHDRQWLALGSLQGCIALLNLRKNGIYYTMLSFSVSVHVYMMMSVQGSRSRVM